MYNTHDYRKMDVTRNLQTKETNRIFRTTLMYTADYDFSIILKSAFLIMNNDESRLQRIERCEGNCLLQVGARFFQHCCR